MTAIVLEGVRKAFGPIAAVDGVDLTIESGAFFSLLGPSGCGKTTLLRLIAGFERPDAGRILIGGVDVANAPPWERPVNTVFQSYALFPHLSVFENVAFGLRQDGMARDALAARVGEMLALVRLDGFDGRKPAQLSGGQRQRVALARALAKLPKVQLLDEPLAALDRRLREDTRAELQRLQERLGITFLMVTHDQEEAMGASHRLGVMAGGRLLQVGAPAEVYARPTSAAAAGLLGRVNLLAGTVAAVAGGRATLDLGALGRHDALAPVTLAVGAPAALALRPERLGLGGFGDSRLEGDVARVAFLGGACLVAVTLAGGIEVTVALPGAATPPARGARVAVSWPADAATAVSP